MNNKEFGKELEGRTKKFALNIIRLSGSLPNTIEGKIVRNQVTKSATSIGANYREANRARSTPDFANKIKICESEASETIYWIEILSELNWIDLHQLEIHLKEANELLALFTSIGKKTKSDNSKYSKL